MFTLRDFVAGALVPAILTAAVLLVGWRLTRRRLAARDSRSWSGPLAVGLGFVGGWMLLFGRPALPPLDVTDWPFYLTIPIVALAMTHAWRGALMQVIVGAALVGIPLVSWTILRMLWQRGELGAITWLLTSALGIGWVLAMEELSRRVPAARSSTVLLLAIGPASIAMMLAGSQVIGQKCGLLAATLAGAVGAHLIMGNAGVNRGTMLVAGGLYGGLLLCAQQFASLPISSALLLYAAPLCDWVGRPLERRWGTTVAVIVQGALVLAVAGAGLALAAAVAFRDEAQYF